MLWHVCIHMCVHSCLFPHAYMMHDVHASCVFLCVCVCTYVCVCITPGEKPCFRLCVTASQIKTCQPCSPAPATSPLFLLILFCHLSLFIPSLHPCCSLKQAPALISQKNNWEVCRLQYDGLPLSPSGLLQQCQLPLEETPGTRAKSNYLYHWLFFSVCLPFSFYSHSKILIYLPTYLHNPPLTYLPTYLPTYLAILY